MDIFKLIISKKLQDFPAEETAGSRQLTLHFDRFEAEFEYTGMRGLYDVLPKNLEFSAFFH